ncbi:MAG: hypothetical protein QM674_08840 [Burkholderiaceae bacterium]
MIAPELPVPDGSCDETFERQRRARIRQALDAFPRLAQAKADLEATARAVETALQGIGDPTAAGDETPADADSKKAVYLQVLKESEGRVDEAKAGIRLAFDVLLTELATAIGRHNRLDSDLAAWFVEGVQQARVNLDNGKPPNLDAALGWAAPRGRRQSTDAATKSMRLAAMVEVNRMDRARSRECTDDEALRAAIAEVLEQKGVAEQRTLERYYAEHSPLFATMPLSEIRLLSELPVDDKKSAL